MMMRLRLFLLVALMLGTAAGIDIEALLKICRNGQIRWTAGVTGPGICKLVNTRLFDGRRIWNGKRVGATSEQGEGFRLWTKIGDT